MNARKSHDPLWIGLLEHVYAGALWLYPPAHRKRWGADMRLAFRDRCREAAHAGRGPWRVLSVLRILPTWFRDLVYRYIARHRYRWFGRTDECRVPTPDIQSRFLA